VHEKVPVSGPMRVVLWACLIGMFMLGIFMQPFVVLAEQAARALVAAG
jgi:NADH:ubiquinone oxidoreductase subunit 2 (subunit N)